MNLVGDFHYNKGEFISHGGVWYMPALSAEDYASVHHQIPILHALPECSEEFLALLFVQPPGRDVSCIKRREIFVHSAVIKGAGQ